MKKVLAIVAMMLLGSSGAWAEGTLANTSIGNTATLNYTVGSEDKTADSNEDTFLVDKKIDLTMSNNDGDQVSVTANTDDQITTWSFRNEGNADQNFTFTAAELTGETIYGDADTDNTEGLELEYYDGTNWVALTTLPVAHDSNISIRIKADIGDKANGTVMNVSLTAQAVTATDNTVNESNTTGADHKTEVDTVLADDANGGNEGNSGQDGAYTRWGGYIVQIPILDLTKLSCVYEDPFNGNGTAAGAEGPKRIPGATIVYVFDINNTGSTDATGLSISDNLPDELAEGTIANVQYDNDEASCACSDGDQYTSNGGGAASATWALSSGDTITISDLNVTHGTHNCVSLEIDIE